MLIRQRKEHEAGQVLLIVVLVMVIVLTVGLSLTSRSIINLRTTQEEENSERAFSAAEAGIEQSLLTNLQASGSFVNNSQYQTTITTFSGVDLLMNNGLPIAKDDGLDIWLTDPGRSAPASTPSPTPSPSLPPPSTPTPTPLSGCAALPPDIIGWWKAENNAVDSINSNNGTVQNGAAYATGKVGRAFSFPSDNFALGKPARASSTWTSGPGYESSKAFDGNTGTRWNADAAANNPHWLSVDLGSVITYNRVVIKEISYPRITSFRLQSSNDGVNYTDIPGTAGTTIGPYKIIPFSSISSRYIRLYMSTASGSPSPTIDEMEVYRVALSSNYARNKQTITSSSYEVSSWSRLHLVDGLRNTSYSSLIPSTSNHTEWVEINFGTVVTFNEVILYPRSDAAYVGAGFPVDFRIQVWDGAAWRDRVIQTNYQRPAGSGQAFTWGFSDTTDRIRIYATNLGRAGGDYALQFGEIEVYQVDYPNVTIPASGGYNLNSQVTLEAWVNPSTINPTVNNQTAATIIAKGNFPTTRNYGIYLTAGGIVHLSYVDSGGNNVILDTPGNTLLANTWQHVVGTIDWGSGGSMKIYVNGVLEASKSISGVPRADTSPLIIGNEDNRNIPFPGSIDEVSLYDRELSLSEIQRIYNAQSVGKCSSAGGGGGGGPVPTSTPAPTSPPLTPTPSASTWSGDITIYWGQSSDTCTNSEDTNTMAALDINVITGTKADSVTTHYPVDPCPQRSVDNNFENIPGSGGTVSGKTFMFRKTINVSSGLLVRIIPLYAPVVIGIRGCNGSGLNCRSLPSQGTLIESVGSSDTVKRKIVSFQSFSKLPVELFPFVLFSPQ